MAGASAVAGTRIAGDGTLTIITRACPACGKTHEITGVPPADFLAWGYGRGELVQVAMPTLTEADRELLLTGMDDECFHIVCADPDDEDDEPHDYAALDEEDQRARQETEQAENLAAADFDPEEL